MWDPVGYLRICGDVKMSKSWKMEEHIWDWLPKIKKKITAEFTEITRMAVPIKKEEPKALIKVQITWTFFLGLVSTSSGFHSTLLRDKLINWRRDFVDTKSETFKTRTCAFLLEVVRRPCLDCFYIRNQMFPPQPLTCLLHWDPTSPNIPTVSEIHDKPKAWTNGKEFSTQRRHVRLVKFYPAKQNGIKCRKNVVCVKQFRSLTKTCSYTPVFTIFRSSYPLSK